MKPPIKKATVTSREVLLFRKRRTDRFRFGHAETADPALLAHTQSALLGIAWKPTPVLSLLDARRLLAGL
jgi:hypothetical protein